MKLSKLESYILSSLIGTAAILVWYLFRYNTVTSAENEIGAGLLVLYISAIALFSLFQIVFALLFLTQKKRGEIEKDERDLIIEMKSYKLSYYFIFSAVILLTLIILGKSVLLDHNIEPDINLLQPYTVFHILFIVTFASYLIQLSTQLFYYRRGF